MNRWPSNQGRSVCSDQNRTGVTDYLSTKAKIRRIADTEPCVLSLQIAEGKIENRLKCYIFRHFFPIIFN